MEFLDLISRIRNKDLTNLEKREFASYIGAYLRRHLGIYATITEIYRYLNKEIEFNQIRDRLKEALDSKDEKEALKILQDTVL